MTNRSYFFELNDILVQFLAAFQNTVISRFNKNREAKELVEVRYVLAPKQRVMYDILDKAQNLTLPVVAVNIASISRDPSRVFNKLEPSYLPAVDNPYGKKIAKVPSPIPVNIEVNMSIITRYMRDMDQIISNFVPYNNPYIILSWTLPAEYGLAYETEIRSEVLWNGSLAYNTPTDTTWNDKFRVVVDTSFTIKAWLFQEALDPADIIYKIDANFHNVPMKNRIYSGDDYESLSAYSLDRNYTDSVTISAIPSITNLFWSTTGWTLPVFEPISIDKSNNNQFIVYGNRFDYNNTFYLSSNNLNFYSNYEAVSSAKSPTISAFNITPLVTVMSDNIFTLQIPANTLTATGNFNIITANSAGWAATDSSYVITAD